MYTKYLTGISNTLTGYIEYRSALSGNINVYGEVNRETIDDLPNIVSKSILWSPSVTLNGIKYYFTSNFLNLHGINIQYSTVYGTDRTYALHLLVKENDFKKIFLPANTLDIEEVLNQYNTNIYTAITSGNILSGGLNFKCRTLISNNVDYNDEIFLALYTGEKVSKIQLSGLYISEPDYTGNPEFNFNNISGYTVDVYRKKYLNENMTVYETVTSGHNNYEQWNNFTFQTFKQYNLSGDNGAVKLFTYDRDKFYPVFGTTKVLDYSTVENSDSFQYYYVDKLPTSGYGLYIQSHGGYYHDTFTTFINNDTYYSWGDWSGDTFSNLIYSKRIPDNLSGINLSISGIEYYDSFPNLIGTYTDEGNLRDYYNQNINIFSQCSTLSNKEHSNIYVPIDPASYVIAI